MKREEAMQNAELDDQSWMQAEPKQKLPVAGYSDFNPAPVVRVRDEAAYEAAQRQIRKSLVWIVISLAMIGLSLYMFTH